VDNVEPAGTAAPRATGRSPPASRTITRPLASVIFQPPVCAMTLVLHNNAAIPASIFNPATPCPLFRYRAR
jgi:hypothetical protein